MTSEIMVRRVGENYVAEAPNYGVMVSNLDEEQAIADAQAAIDEAKRLDAGKPMWWEAGKTVVSRLGRRGRLVKEARRWKVVSDDGLTSWINPDPRDWLPLPSPCLSRTQIARTTYDAKWALMNSVGRPVPQWIMLPEDQRYTAAIDTRGDHELTSLLSILGGAVEAALAPYCNE